MCAVEIPWTALLEHRAWLSEQCRRLLAFGAGASLADGGAAHLDDDGGPDSPRGARTRITVHMTHVYSLGILLGVPGCEPVADRALAGRSDACATTSTVDGSVASTPTAHRTGSPGRPATTMHSP